MTLAERLKFELRHNYTSSGRQESVAEHTWRMALMGVLIEPLLTQKVDIARLLKMIIIHDMVEAEAKESFEAKVVNALDKLEVQLQHNDADFSTWEKIECDMCYMMDKQVLFDETLFELKQQIEKQAEEKMKLAGIDTDAVRKRAVGLDEVMMC